MSDQLRDSYIIDSGTVNLLFLSALSYELLALYGL